MDDFTHLHDKIIIKSNEEIVPIFFRWLKDMGCYNEYISNIKKLKQIKNIKQYKQYILRILGEHDNNIGNLISVSFTWSHAEEAHGYWCDLYFKWEKFCINNIIQKY